MLRELLLTQGYSKIEQCATILLNRNTYFEVKDFSLWSKWHFCSLWWGLGRGNQEGFASLISPPQSFWLWLICHSECSQAQWRIFMFRNGISLMVKKNHSIQNYHKIQGIKKARVNGLKELCRNKLNHFNIHCI